MIIHTKKWIGLRLLIDVLFRYISIDFTTKSAVLKSTLKTTNNHYQKGSKNRYENNGLELHIL